MKDKVDVGRLVLPVVSVAAFTIDKGGFTITRERREALTGYSIGTGIVEVKTTVSLYEIERAIEFVSNVLNRSVGSINGEIFRNHEDQYLGVGTWIPKDRSYCVTELVHVYPDTILDEETARYIGKLRKQYSIYNLREKREIKTGYSETYEGG